MSEIMLGVLKMPDEMFWSDDPITRYQHNIIRLEAAAEIERLRDWQDVVYKYIDRMNDVAPECGDPAERILEEFTAAVQPLLDRDREFY